MIKTILVDDDFLVLQALETILSVQDHIEVVGTGQDGKDAVELYITHQPDLVLMDIRMEPDRKSTRLNSSHIQKSRMPSSA